MSDAPLFLLGTERSGSNLLRLILNAHSGIHIPHPPHIVRYFAPLEASYGDLSNIARFRDLVGDVLLLLRAHTHPWPFHPTVDDGGALAPSRSVFGVFAAVYELSRAKSGKRRWGCKSTFMIHNVDDVLRHFPDARLLHLVRDPRDVVVSSRKSVFSPFHPYFTAKLWQEQQAVGQVLGNRIPDSQLMVLRYEDLLLDSEQVTRRICAFLGEDFEAGMMRFFETDEARTSARLSESWRNTGSPILRGNAEKFRKELSMDEIRLVEQVCGPVLLAFGYTPVVLSEDAARVSEWSPDAAQLTRWRLMDLRWRAEVEARSLRNDKNHWRRWTRDFTMKALAAKARWRGTRM